MKWLLLITFLIYAQSRLVHADICEIELAEGLSALGEIHDPFADNSIVDNVVVIGGKK